MTYYQNMQAMQAKRYLHKFDEIVKTMRTKTEQSQRTTNISLDFISEMILHHEGAIEMCKNLLQYKIDPRLRKIAENIIITQTEVIKQMQAIARKPF